MQVQSMEESAKEIQRERMQPLEDPKREKTVPANEGPTEKASVFCFKKRKKPCIEGIDKNGDRESESLNQHSRTVLSSEAEESKPSWTTGGAWLAFKRLVTLRRRSKSALKKDPQLDSRVQVETRVEESSFPHLPKEKASSGLKIPCLRFSRRKKRSGHSEITEELDQGEKTNETTSLLNNKAHNEPERLTVDNSVSNVQSCSRAPEETEGGVEITHGDMIISTGENTLAVEMRPCADRYTDCLIQSEIIHSETVLETEEEKQIFQLHHGSLYGSPEEAEKKVMDFTVEIGPLVVCQDLPGDESEVFEVQDTSPRHTQEVELETSERNIKIGEETNDAGERHSVEVLLHCSPSTLADEALSLPNCFAEKAKSEENKLPHGAGIVITITEAEESQDEEELSLACEYFPFPNTSKQKGNKKSSKGVDSRAGSSGRKKEGESDSQVPSPLGTNDQECWTAEQHESLLIETAASLVKAAIQSSVEQLVNEMALEQNKQNSFL
ncbi:A-kinase anchor protein 5 [Eublepharis macularius]|uniref:A-kinase anchor protein 5 n=1 Tax=Eublepharis macularius TaxID=481883 RepID=A0AA97KRZ9_EUBMA|nr:A-kinase anchor protein 5 [Eublepharis macularius]XP_054827642.1 A-kinase anchor protein 5 [Eublepharis macularius]XP_054827643.1 A-kinase anchor protein 5 [Eublepharis macularius]